MSQKKTGGLAGVIAGRTEICTVGKEGAGLTYRGYDIYDLADNACFRGSRPPAPSQAIAQRRRTRRLPEHTQVAAFAAGRAETCPGSHPGRHPSHGRAAHGLLGAGQPGTGKGLLGAALRRRPPASRLPVHAAVLAPVSRRRASGSRPTPTTTAWRATSLHLLHDAPPSELHRRTLDTSLILYAEHEFNASTFTARVIAATLCGLSLRDCRRHRCAARTACTAGPTRRPWS